jgi:hypothetical protein
MAFTLISGARHSLHPTTRAGPLTTPQASRHATDRSVAPPEGAFDTGLRRRTFPSDTASLLPGHLAATRTGLTPASDDELTTKDHLQPATSSLLGARKTEAKPNSRLTLKDRVVQQRYHAWRRRGEGRILLHIHIMAYYSLRPVIDRSGGGFTC